MNAKEALTLPEPEFWVEVSRVITAGPWKHDLAYMHDGTYVCLRCREAWPTLMCYDGRHFSQKRLPPCPVPAPLEDSLAELAFSLRDRIADKAELLRAVHIITRVLSFEGDADLWYAYFATPREQITCALVALGLWGVGM